MRRARAPRVARRQRPEEEDRALSAWNTTARPGGSAWESAEARKQTGPQRERGTVLHPHPVGVAVSCVSTRKSQSTQ